MRWLWLLVIGLIWAGPAWADDTDDAARLEFAAALANVPGHEEEALSALSLFLDASAQRDRAAFELAGLLATEPGRAGWVDHYRRIQPPAELQQAFAMRQAQAQAAQDATRRQASQTLKALLRKAPEDRALRMTLAQVELRRGNPAGAIDALRTLDHDEEARGLQVLAYLAVDDLARANVVAGLGVPNASSTLTKALDEGSLSLRVRAVGLGGWPETAEKILRDADPGGRDLSAWDGLARSWLRAGEAERAAETWRIAVRAAPDDAELRARYVRALVESGQTATAMREVGGDDEEALRLIEAAQLAEGALGGRDTEDARWEQILQAQQRAPDLWMVQRALGLLQSRRGEHGAALRNLEASLVRRPVDVLLLEAHAVSSIANRVPERMVDRHREAVRQASDPGHRSALVQRLSAAHRRAGDYLDSAGHPGEALFSWRVALAMAPDDFDNRRALAAGLWNAGHLDAAATAYRQLVDRSPGRVDLLQDALEVEVQRGRPDLARALLEEAAGLDDDTRSRLAEKIERANVLYRARAQADADDLSGAIEILRSGAQVWPDDAPIAHALGDRYMEAGRPRDALPWYGRARTNDPANVWIVLAEANCLAMLAARQPAEYLLDGLGDELDEEQAAIARDIRLRALRAEADGLRDDWENEAAFELYARLLEIEADPYVLTSLGGLYLRHAQPGLAEAFYAEALDRDPTMLQAELGRIRALDQLGRSREGWSLARELPQDDPEVRALLEVLEVRIVMQAGDEARIEGRFHDAEELLRKVLARYPLNADARALLAALRLDQRRYDEALQLALDVLRDEPVHGRALAVATEVALAQNRSDVIEELYLTALFEGQEVWIRKGLANARLAALVEEAERLADAGELDRGRNLVRGTATWLDDDTGRMSLVGRGYLAVGLPAEAEVVFDDALSLDDSHSGAIIGKAGTLRARGRAAAAESYLQDEAERTQDPRVWMALARTQHERGYRARAEDSLRRAHELPASGTATRTWSADSRLPALPLPSGRDAQDLPPSQQAEVVAVMPHAELEELGDSLGPKQQPGFQAELGVWSRPGTAGTSELLVGVGHIGMLDLVLPGFVLDAELEPLYATDDVHSVIGVGLGARLRTSPALPRGVALELGTNPLGFGNFDWHARLSGRVSLRPGGEFGLGLTRMPITDSVTSWAGVPDAGGDDFGRVAFNFLSGWIVRDAVQTPLDAGLLVRGGVLTGLQLERALRLEAMGWWGWTLDDELWWARGGMDGYWLSDRPSVDGWAPPDGGVFSPEAFGSLLARVDGELMLADLPLGVCGGISAGLQVLQDEGDPGIWFDQGVSGIAEVRLGGQAWLAESWRLLLEGRWTAVGTGYRERTAVLHVEWVPDVREDTLPRSALVTQGRVPSSVLACKRPVPVAHRPQDFRSEPAGAE